MSIDSHSTESCNTRKGDDLFWREKKKKVGEGQTQSN